MSSSWLLNSVFNQVTFVVINNHWLLKTFIQLKIKTIHALIEEVHKITLDLKLLKIVSVFSHGTIVWEKRVTFESLVGFYLEHNLSKWKTKLQRWNNQEDWVMGSGIRTVYLDGLNNGLI